MTLAIPNITVQAVMAATENGGIGLNGQLPWPRIKEDMKNFVALTRDTICVVGRKTYESIENRLEGRMCIVLGSKKPTKLKLSDTWMSIDPLDIVGIELPSHKYYSSIYQKESIYSHSKELWTSCQFNHKRIIDLFKLADKQSLKNHVKNDMVTISIVGGKQVYELFMNITNTLHLTVIHEEHKADTFMNLKAFPIDKNINVEFHHTKAKITTKSIRLKTIYERRL